MTIILHLLAMYGITFVIKDSFIFDGIRQFLSSKSSFLSHLFGCPYCIGFYSGSIVFLLTLPEGITTLDFFRGQMLYAFSGVAFSGVWDNFCVWLERRA